MRTNRRLLLSLSLLALLVLGCASASTGVAMQDNDVITVTGRLERIVAVGAETTGISVKLDSTLTRGKKVYRRLDVDRKGVDISPLIGTHVEVTGKLVSRKGTERGEYPALELISIRRLE